MCILVLPSAGQSIFLVQLSFFISVCGATAADPRASGEKPAGIPEGIGPDGWSVQFCCCCLCFLFFSERIAYHQHFWRPKNKDRGLFSSGFNPVVQIPELSCLEKVIKGGHRESESWLGCVYGRVRKLQAQIGARLGSLHLGHVLGQQASEWFGAERMPV